MVSKVLLSLRLLVVLNVLTVVHSSIKVCCRVFGECLKSSLFAKMFKKNVAA